MLKTVASGMRCNASTVPSRSATAMVIRVREPHGSRITARVKSAVDNCLIDDLRHIVLRQSGRSARWANQIALGWQASG